MLRILRRLLRGRTEKAQSQAPSDSPLEAIDRADTAERIEILARGGFETEASTLETILDEYLNPDEIDPEDRRWVEAEVARAFARKRADEATWPLETDFDRLAIAFDALDASGIIALHDAGYTRSDGISDAAEIYHQRRERGRASRGFVFYHGQDVEAVVCDRGLYLAFGAFDDRDATMVAIAAEIVAAVEAQGLRTHWEGDVGTRILVHPIRWLKRSPSDDPRAA
ncbi:DUF6891 domain-containing protein [Methylorubrum extorquens]|uniref:DUF6891 domain-containing protein n=1 Tax=Methylorubrum extorquens TaxID=408 RepID=UPI0001590A68|nr:hypothetical protein [Methylorubrum extorquens]ABY29314.1 conserved hypothetical protein [Methylorubrum extorquens PA1]KQP89483.1 hypothetical protein ASF55_23760 [Methylobacterium sp. Leaf119]WIU40651.1 hypothetical protein KQ926_04780 [Methylorubrum extorquens]